MCRIMTSNYENCVTENGISISGDGGKKANFKGLTLPILAPKKEFWKVWHDNIGKIPEEENNKYYVKQYYEQVLKKLDPKTVLNMIPDGSILLCYEDHDEFCHRHIFSAWIELFLGIQTSEVIENPRRETVTRVSRPDYLKKVLEDVIKENYPMHNFQTINEAYEYNRKKSKEKKLKLIM